MHLKIASTAFLAALVVQPLYLEAGEAALVSTRTIYPGQNIPIAALSNVDLSECPDCRAGFVRDRLALAGKIATKTILANQPIYPDALRNAPTVFPRQQVDLFYFSGKLTISMRGEALQEAGIGDAIQVRNRESGVVVSGKVNFDGTIMVNPR